MTLLDVALAADAAGLCVLPPAQDGTKRPLGKHGEWKQYQQTRSTEAEIRQWYANGRTGIGYVCGAVSGGLLMFEFEGRAVADGVDDAYADACDAAGIGELWWRILDAYTETTPSGGMHVLWRCPEPRCLKLAYNVDGLVMIETKGEGGYTIAAPSSGTVHPTGGEWTVLIGDVANIPTLTAEESDALLDVALKMNRLPAPTPQPPAPPRVRTTLPGEGWMDSTIADWSNRTPWHEVLAGHFEWLGDEGTEGHWHFIGAENRLGATTNHFGTDRMLVFSGTAGGRGFETYDGLSKTTTYDKLDVLLILRDRRTSTEQRTAEARRLNDEGYGRPRNEEPVALMAPPPAKKPQAEGEAQPEPEQPEAEWLGPTPIDWTEFWKRDRTDIEWIAYPVLPKGRQAAMWAIHKTGKSLITLDIAASAATGRSVLGSPAAAPISVIYLDLEMTEDDVEERLSDFGYSGDDDLSNLHYFLLPSLPPLDTMQGGEVLAALVDRHQAELVVIDTVSRVIRGEENDADTFRNFYLWTGLALKQRNVTLLRLDHGGKDPTKGQRGTSAKGDDVDIVWKLEPAEDGLVLKRERARMSWVPERVNLKRETEPLRHVVTDGRPFVAGTKEVAQRLEALGVPADWSFSRTRARFAELEETPPGKQKFHDAQRYRNDPASLLVPGTSRGTDG